MNRNLEAANASERDFKRKVDAAYSRYRQAVAESERLRYPEDRRSAVQKAYTDYKDATDPLREPLAKTLDRLYGKIADDFKAAFGTAPDGNAKRVTETLSAMPSVSQADVDAAKWACEGNFMAESALNAVADKSGRERPFAVPTLKECLNAVEKEKKKRVEHAWGYRKASAWVVRDSAIDAVWEPDGCTYKSFNAAMDALESHS